METCLALWLQQVDGFAFCTSIRHLCACQNQLFQHLLDGLDTVTRRCPNAYIDAVSISWGGLAWTSPKLLMDISNLLNFESLSAPLQNKAKPTDADFPICLKALLRTSECPLEGGYVVTRSCCIMLILHFNKICFMASIRAHSTSQW